MTIVIDANILISGILNPYSQLSEFILSKNPKIDFVIPEYAIEEINAHKQRICKQSKTSLNQFEQVLEIFLSCILCFSTEAVKNSDIISADNLVADIDTKDIWYVALVIALDAILWTGDMKLYRGLRRKGFKKIITTKELKEIIKGL